MDKETGLFFADVQALQLKRPVSQIAKRTGDDKGNVSSYLSGRKSPPYAFIIRFYNAFLRELAEIGIKRDISRLTVLPSPSPSPVIDELWQKINQSLDKQLNTLKEINERSERIEQKIDQLLKWSKYGGQIWDRN